MPPSVVEIVFAYVCTDSEYALVHCMAISTAIRRSVSSDSKSMISGWTTSTFLALFRCLT